MNWLLKDLTSRRPAHLPRHIERRLRFALARFGTRVVRVIVILQDCNGPRGGIDKACRVMANVEGCGAIVATAVDSEWTAAVDQAVARVGHAVSRRLGRLRERQLPAVRRFALD